MGKLKDKLIEMNKNNNGEICKEKYNNKITIVCGYVGSGKTTATLSSLSADYALFCGDAGLDILDLLAEVKLTDKIYNGNEWFEDSVVVEAMKNGQTVVIGDVDYLSDKVLDFIEKISIEDEIDVSEYHLSDKTIKISPEFNMVLIFTTPSRVLS